MRGKWIKNPRQYDPGYNPHEKEMNKLVLWYHTGKISKESFERQVAELLGEEK